MTHRDEVKQHWRAGVAGTLVVLAVSICWYARDMALAYGWLRVDALSAWFLALVAIGFGTIIVQGEQRVRPGYMLAVACVSFAMATTSLPFIALGVPLATLSFTVVAAPNHRRDAMLWGIAGASLLLGYGTLFARGISHYNGANPGGALLSTGFWCTLLGTLAALLALLRHHTPLIVMRVFAPAWLYPLMRLYSLGEWQIEWSVATLLLGGALAGWCTFATLAEPRPPQRMARSSVAVLAGALAGVGLGSGAGIVAACYGLLCYVVLLAGERRNDWAGAHPFSAAFVASWMLSGASLAGGAGMLAGVFWLAVLLAGLGWALWGAAPSGPWLGVASFGLGIGAPLLARALLAPVAGQLAGGLSPYGDMSVWPWVGMAATDAAQTPVASWPVIAAALLLLVLLAFLALALRLRPASPVTEEIPASAATIAALHEHVPWLALLRGAPASTEGTGDEPR